MANAQTGAIRAVACVEALKGAVVLLAATGLFAAVHHDLHAAAAAFVAPMHLNPASRYPRIFLELAAHLDDSRLLMLAAGASAYALARLIESYGLFRERAWAEVLAALSGAIDVPFEVFELARHPTWPGALLLALNLAIVAIMAVALVKRRERAG